MKRFSTLKISTSVFAIGFLFSATAVFAVECPSIVGGIDYCPTDATAVTRCATPGVVNSCGAAEMSVPAGQYLECGTCVLVDQDIKLGPDSIQSGSNLIQSASTTPYFVITADGKVGLGTTTPALSLVVDSTDGMQIPVGDTAERPGSPTAGVIRYNTEQQTFEGHDGSNWGSLGGLIDVDQDTKVTAESAPGQDEDALTFYTGSSTAPNLILDQYGNVNLTNAGNRYINFGSATSTDGYGLWDDSGVLKFRNSADTVWSEVGSGGTTIKVPQVSHGFLAGDVLKASSTVDGVYEKAQADSLAGAEVVGIVSEKIDDDMFVIATNGYIDGLSGLSRGEVYYLSTSTPGGLIATSTTSEGEISKPLFIASSPSSGYFYNMRGVEIAGESTQVNFGTAGQMAYYTTASGVGSTANLVASGTSIGIGTSTPDLAYKLDVYGNTRIDGNLTINDINANSLTLSTVLDESYIDDSIARDTELHSILTLSGTRDYITLSGQDIVRGVVDISDDTNIATSTGLSLTGDTLGLVLSGSSLINTSGLSLNLGNANTWTALQTLNGGATLGSGATLDIDGSLEIATTSVVFNGASTNFDTTGDFSINTDKLFIEKDNGNIGLGTTTPSSSLVIATTDGIQIPAGNISERPASSSGMIRFNTEINSYEGFNNSAWSSLGGVIDNDQNTKAYVSQNTGDDWIKFNTAGTERLIIDSNGNVGIGTTSPAANLAVKAIAGDNILNIASSSGESVLKIDSDGIVQALGGLVIQNVGSQSAEDAIIAAGNDGQMWLRTDEAYNASMLDVQVADGGTGKSSWTQYAIPYMSDATTFGELTIGTANQVLMVNGSANGYTWSNTTNWDTAYTNRVDTWPTALDFSGNAVSLNANYNIPLTASTTNWNTAFNTVTADSANWDSAYADVTASSTEWGDAYTDRLKWDGSATDLNAATARASLDLEVGTDVQVYNANTTLLGQTIGSTELEDDSVASTTLNIDNNWASGQFLSQDGAGVLTWADAAASLEELTDVDLSTTATSTGQTLRFNGTKWVNTSALVIDASGNVGIGTSTPDVAFQVSSSTDPNIKIQSSTNDGQLMLGYNTSGNYAALSTKDNDTWYGDTLVLTEGNIGIGTTSPLADLDVFGDMILSSSTSYISFGPTLGDTGYGIRNNEGTLEFKNTDDTSWSEIGSGGSTQKVASSSHGFVVGDILRFATTTASYVKAQADSNTNAEVVGIVSEVINSDNFVLTTGGYVDLTDGTDTFTPGETYFLATSTAGSLIATEPGYLNEVSKPLFTATDTKKGFFTNYRGVENAVSLATVNTGTATYMAYYTAGNTVHSTDALVVSGGGVGIGTTTPDSGTYQLDVDGATRITGGLTVDTLNAATVDMGSEQFINDSGTLKWGASGEEVAISDRSHVWINQSNSFSVGDAVRIDTGTGNYVAAKADTVENAEVVGVVSEATGTTFVLSTSGLVTGLTGLVTGETYYLATSTAGDLISTAPTGLGEISKPVMIAKSTTEAYVINYRGVQLDNFSVNTGATGEMAYYTTSNIVGSTDSLMIDGTNVGIGTSTPASKLTIENGDVFISSNSSGIIMRDTVSGTCYRIRMASGALAPEALANCPGE